MTRDDIIRMASEAELFEKYQVFYVTIPELERFAQLVAAAEREECAKLCEEERINATHYSATTQSNWLAKKIRSK